MGETWEPLVPDEETNGHSVWGIVLAAGQSSRMGEQKLLLPLEGGVPMVRQVLHTAAASRLAHVLVVVSAGDEAVQQMTRPASGSTTWLQVQNPNADEGMSTSLKAGIAEAERHGAHAAVILLGDQPGITTEHINGIVDSYRSIPAPIVQATYDGTPSHPILFDRALFDELLSVTGDEGGRKVLQSHRAERRLVAFAGQVPVDLDTPEAYRAWMGGHTPTD